MGSKVNGASLDLCSMMVFNAANGYLHYNVLRKERSHSSEDMLSLKLVKD